MKMISQRIKLPALLAAILFALSLPVVASAQFGNGPWNRDRDYRRDRDRDYRRDRDDDYYRTGRNSDYDRRTLRDTVRRIESRSKDFERGISHYLDRSRYNGSEREDRINEVANEFHDVANSLKDRVGDGRNPERGANEAQRLLQMASRIDRFMQRNDTDSRTYSDWSQIRQDLNVLSNFYGYRGGYSDRDPYYRRGGYEQRRSPWGW